MRVTFPLVCSSCANGERCENHPPWSISRCSYQLSSQRAVAPLQLHKMPVTCPRAVKALAKSNLCSSPTLASIHLSRIFGRYLGNLGKSLRALMLGYLVILAKMLSC